MVSRASLSAFAPHTFFNLVSFKLTDKNYLLWEQEVIATIKGHKLQNHLHKELIPNMYLSDADAIAGNLSLSILIRNNKIICCSLSY